MSHSHVSKWIDQKKALRVKVRFKVRFRVELLVNPHFRNIDTFGLGLGLELG